MDELLPKVGDSLFQVFRQADRGFIILSEEGKLIPKVIKTRHGDDAGARFSRTIINRCLTSGEALLSEDASSGKGIDLSQSIADCKIARSCAPRSLAAIRKKPSASFSSIPRTVQEIQARRLAAFAGGGGAGGGGHGKRHHAYFSGGPCRTRTRFDVGQASADQLPAEKTPADQRLRIFRPLRVGPGSRRRLLRFRASPQRQVGRHGRRRGRQGCPCRLLMSKVSSDARFTLLTEPGLAETVYKLNELMQEAGLLDRFVTLGACLLDPASHQVTCVSAGHMPPVIYRKATGTLEEATPRDLAGFPLGVADGIPYEASTITLEPGDSLLLYTDGVTEAKNKQEVEFQMEGVYTALKAGPMTPKAMGERLAAAVKKHFVGCKQHDDITVVCFGRL